MFGNGRITFRQPSENHRKFSGNGPKSSENLRKQKEQFQRDIRMVSPMPFFLCWPINVKLCLSLFQAMLTHWTKKIIVEEGHTVAQLVHMLYVVLFVFKSS